MIEKGRIGGYLGALIGCTGWMIGFTVVCLVSGNLDVWARFAFLGFALSIAMGGLFIITSELTLRAFGPGGMFQLVLWAELTFFMGTLLLLLNHWIAPALETSPAMLDTLRGMGSVYKTSDFTPGMFLAASVVLTGVAAWRLIRTEPRPGA
jgi:hypothetical protein